jgi:hypothetical protein
MEKDSCDRRQYYPISLRHLHMVPEGLSQCLKVSAACSYPEPAESSSQPSHRGPVSSISLLFSHVMLLRPSSSLPFRFPIKIFLCTFLFHAWTFTYKFIFFDRITLIAFGWEYNSWSYSLRGFLQPSVSSSFLGPNTFSTSCSPPPSAYDFPSRKTPSFTPI